MVNFRPGNQWPWFRAIERSVEFCGLVSSGRSDGAEYAAVISSIVWFV